MSQRLDLPRTELFQRPDFRLAASSAHERSCYAAHLGNLGGARFIQLQIDDHDAAQKPGPSPNKSWSSHQPIDTAISSDSNVPVNTTGHGHATKHSVTVR